MLEIVVCGAGGHLSLPVEDWVCTSLISGSYDLGINLTTRRQDTHIKTQIDSNVFREYHILLDFVFCQTLPTFGRPSSASGLMHQENSIIFYVLKVNKVISKGVSTIFHPWFFFQYIAAFTEYMMQSVIWYLNSYAINYT